MKQKSLLVASTIAEVSGLVGTVAPYKVTPINDNWNVLITGVGMVPTVFHLSQALHEEKYLRIMNIGLAGAINRNLLLEEVVNVIDDEFAFWGSEDNDDYLSVFDLNLQKVDESPFTNRKLIPLATDFSIATYKKVHGLTVQTVTGSSNSLLKLNKYYAADIESMEGAAVFYVANQFGIPALQLRAISNYVEPRNRKSWRMKEALSALFDAVRNLIA